jgi:hypothetical protein
MKVTFWNSRPTKEITDFVGKDLRYADLSGTDLSGTNLRYADLSDANLTRADLSDANLRGADLTRADFTRADLTRADLRNASLRSAGLSGASLRCADLSGASLRCADLSGATLIDANLRGADFRGANLTGVVLSDQPLSSPYVLLAHLNAHILTKQYNQEDWCGTCCCLSGAAGGLINNQTLGVAVIRVVLPEFDIEVLYSSNRDNAIAELQRVTALYRVRELTAQGQKAPETVPVRVSIQ